MFCYNGSTIKIGGNKMTYDNTELQRVYQYTYAHTRWFVRIPEREKEYSQRKW